MPLLAWTLVLANRQELTDDEIRRFQNRDDLRDLAQRGAQSEDAEAKMAGLQVLQWLDEPIPAQAAHKTLVWVSVSRIPPLTRPNPCGGPGCRWRARAERQTTPTYGYGYFGVLPERRGAARPHTEPGRRVGLSRRLRQHPRPGLLPSRSPAPLQRMEPVGYPCASMAGTTKSRHRE